MTSNRPALPKSSAKYSASLLAGAALLLVLTPPAMAQETKPQAPSPAAPQSAADVAQPAAEILAVNAAPVPYVLVAGQKPAPIDAIPQNTALTPWDAQLYQAAFDLIDAGDFDGADLKLADIKDRSLIGYAQFHKLFSRKYTASYDELMAWLKDYGDQPMAMRVWGLAKRKKPAGAPDPAFPSLSDAVPAQAQAANASAAVQLVAGVSLSDGKPATTFNPGAPTDDSALTPKSARSAYNNGQLEDAVKLGRKIGDHWVAGLASWRLGRYDQAQAEFKFVASDPSRNAWSQSGGAYWAGRCASKLGHKEEAETWFKVAASFPFTFYGLVAEQRLGATPAVVLSKKGQTPTFSGESRTALTAALDGDFSWTHDNPKAQRLNALIQIGRVDDAQDELQAAVQTASNGEERDRWLAMSARTRLPVTQLKPADRLFDASLYPIPDFAPKGGYTVPKALIFAFARKESKFNPKAHSYSGAYGLLQLMPATAALVENDPSLSAKPAQLLTPAVNLRVGQNYINRLMDSKIIEGDLLRTIAAYNAGPGPVKDAKVSLGEDADSLLFMESIPVAQTRQYVEEVAANYWIYRQLMGQPTKSLALAATDAHIIDATVDK